MFEEPGGEPVPFLRGILVQSLISAGLSFSDAYATAQTVREHLGDRESLSTAELAQHVAKVLEECFGAEVRQAYETKAQGAREIVVRTPGGKAPFSVGMLAHSLEAYAIDPECGRDAAGKIQDALQQGGQREIDSQELRRSTYQYLRERCSKKAAARYLSWYRFEKSGDPLILLIGGATGTGKSTVSAALAYRLDIARTQSTDMMREIIRAYLAPHVVPTLGYSSFEAWRGLPRVKSRARKRATDNPVIAGFLSQVGNVKAALEATIARAVKERHHLIIDGVHVLPTELNLSEATKKAVVVSFTLAVTTRQRLLYQLARRSREQPGRGSSRHLNQIDAIWDLQSYLLGIADNAGIPIIANWDLDACMQRILDEISHRISERYPPDPGILDS